MNLNGWKMIIKRTMKFDMPNLKRCKLEEPGGEDFAYSGSTKKRRTNGYYSLCSNGDVEDFSSGSGSWFNDESYWAGEVESNLKRLNGDDLSLNPNSDGFQRSLRGRVRTIPSRFNNSVLSVWKNEPKFDETDTSFDEEDSVEVFMEEDTEKIDGLGILRKPKKEKYTYKNSKSFQDGVKEEDDDLGCIGFNNFDYAKYIGLKIDDGTFPSMGAEDYDSSFRYSGVRRLKKTNVGKRKEIYRPEDFALGDIVWAKCGRSYPAWPAVVIDPLLQAPEAVLRCCVPGAICVMFYGFSKNGKQRVKFSVSLLC